MKIIITIWDASLYFIYHFFEKIGSFFTKIKKTLFKRKRSEKDKCVKGPKKHRIRNSFESLQNKISSKIKFPQRKQRTNKKKRKRIKERLSAKQYETFLGYLFISPWIIGALVFTVYPVISVIKYSFEKVVIASDSIRTAWIGTESYINLFLVNNVFKDGLKDVFLTLIIQIPIIIVVSIFFAVMLSKNIKGTGIFKAIFFLPVIILSGPMLDLMGQLGIIGSDLENASELYLALSSLDNVFVNIVLYLVTNIESIIWFSAIPTLVFLVIIQQMNDDLYEAADMDGASGSEKFWKVTLPQLKMGININIIYLVMFMGTFSTNPVVKEIQDKMFSLQHGLGYASAEAVLYMLVLFSVIIILVLAVNGLPKFEKKSKRRLTDEKV